MADEADITRFPEDDDPEALMGEDVDQDLILSYEGVIVLPQEIEFPEVVQ